MSTSPIARFLLAALLAAAMELSAQAADYTWQGPAGGIFSTGSNWSPSGPPAGSDVGIFRGASGAVTFVSGTTAGSNLWIDNSTISWDIGAGNTLLTGSNESIRIGSPTAGSTSSLAVTSGTVNALGNVRVARDNFPNGSNQTAADATGTLSISGTGTQFLYQGILFAGGASGKATINVTDGALLLSTRTAQNAGILTTAGALQLTGVNLNNGPASVLNVSGAGTVADLGGTNNSGFGAGLILSTGLNSAPAVNVTSGGYLHTLSLKIGVVGQNNGAESKVLVDGAGSKLRFERPSTDNPANDNASVIAFNALARVTVQNSGLIEAANNLQVVLGAAGRDGTLEIIGAGSRYVAVSPLLERRNVTLGTVGQAGVATLRLAQGGLLDLSNGGSLANGTLTLATTNSRLIGSGGTIRAEIVNNGLLSLGDGVGEAGALNLVGTYTAQPGATHLFEIGGTDFSLYDHVTATGALAFDGSLSVSFISPFTAAEGDHFDLFSGSSSSGVFSSTSLPILGAGLSWEESYTGGYRLTVVPEPSGFLLVAMGLGAFLWLGKTRKRTA